MGHAARSTFSFDRRPEEIGDEVLRELRHPGQKCKKFGGEK